MRKRIFAVTGTRADYGIYHPVFSAIAKSKDLSLGLIVVGMHLKQRFGMTVDVIRKDGFPIVAALDTLTDDDTPAGMATYVGRTLIEMAKTLEKDHPDLLLLLGDRGEQLAGAISAAELRIPIAHLHGGERSGTVDDAMRHAITQMATVHLTSAQPHAEAVARMRGSAENTHVVGAPALDVIASFAPLPKDELLKKAGFDPALPTVIFVQHADPIDPLSPAEQIDRSIEALMPLKANILILGTNADAGGALFNERLSAFAKKHAHARFFITLPHAEHLSWLAHCDALVGNSSSGIIEAASFHVPAVNIGGRQRGRMQSGNVIDVPYDAKAIKTAMEKALRGKIPCVNAYGDGTASKRIVSILEEFLAHA